jgi:thioredoxin 1
MALKEVTDSSFVAEVVESETPVVVDFWAPWCGPCRAVSPLLEQLAEEHPEWKFVKVNVDDNQHTAASYGIQSIPTMVVMQHGGEAGRIIGGRPKAAIESGIAETLA